MQTSWIIGAAERCDIRVTSPYVSAEHCRLDHGADGWMLEDLGSTNGTFVNGERIVGRAVVAQTDVITLGRHVALPWPDTAVAAGHRLRLPRAGETVVVGRSRRCDVVVPFPMISARHAVIEERSDRWFVRDLGSTNGTYVGNRRITAEAEVRPGDCLGLGTHRLSLVLDETASRSEARTGPAAVTVSSLAVDVAGRRLLDGISLAALPGELVGVMGASGVGKSTLLSAIVGEQTPAGGGVQIFGIDVHVQWDRLRGQVGYVPQEDIMHSGLTVEQALTYTARLRLPPDHGREEIRARVDEVIAQLGLQGAEKIRIGSAARRGISGGQRKRVNAAMEMITDPRVLVLDEPTSGLSSVDALSFVHQLRKLADAGKTVILTIHQPSSDILKLLSAVVVLGRDTSTGGVGRLAWYGPAYPAAAAFFEPDAPTPAGGPDAEAILRGLAARPVLEWQERYRRTATCRDWVTARVDGDAAPPAAVPHRGIRLREFLHQAAVLLRRSFAVTLADRWNAAMLLVQAPAIATLIACAFGAQASKELTEASWAGVTRAIAMTTFLLALAAVWFGCSNAAREIVDERAIFRRERMAGLLPLAYLGSKLAVLGLVCSVQSGVLLAGAVYGCGLDGDCRQAFAALVLAAAVGTVIGLNVSAAASSSETAAAVLPLVVLPLVVLGGVLVPIAELSTTLGLFADLMPTRWAFEWLLADEAGVRALLEAPDPAVPGATRLVDIAEAWFPAGGWRSRPGTPLVVLAAIWLIGVTNVAVSLARRPR